MGDLFYVADPADYTPADCVGAEWTNDCVAVASTFQGTRTSLTMDEVVARHGSRFPAYGEAQTEFRFAFVLVCGDEDACDPGVYAWADEQRAAFVETYATATGGRGAIDTTL